jgi:hypothetical protein
VEAFCAGEKETQPGTVSHPAARKTQRRPGPKPEKPIGGPKKKDVVDRQLKLFDDE